MFKIKLKFSILLVVLFANGILYAQDAQPSVSAQPDHLVAVPIDEKEPRLETLVNKSVSSGPDVPTELISTDQAPAGVPELSATAESTELSGEAAIPKPESTELPGEAAIPKPESTALLSEAVIAPLKWKIEGGFGFMSYLLPSSSYAKNNFSGPALNILGRKQLNISNIKLQNKYFVQASFDLFAAKQAPSGHFSPLLRDAFLELRNSVVLRSFKLGYFLSPMLERERSFWKAYRLGPERAGLWERYSYLKTTEAGFEYGSLNSNYQWSIGFSNGDAENAEPMIQKDIFLLWEVLPEVQASFYGGLSAQKGWYEGLPIKINNKDRAFIWWGYRDPSGFQFTIEGFAAIDAVDGLKKPVAEGVDHSLKAGKLVRASGEALLVGKNFKWNSQKFRLDLKIDELDPDVEKKFNSVQSNSIAVSIPNEIGQFTFSLENMYLQKYHSIGDKVRSTIRLDYLIEI